MVSTLLVIDDEPSIQHAFRRAFRNPDLTLMTASSGAEGLSLIQSARPAVVLLDIHLPDQSGLDIFKQIKAIDARIPVIFITGHGTTDTAIEAMKLGAYDYLLKPLPELEPLRELVARALEISRLMHTPALFAAEQAGSGPSDVLVGRCPAMHDVYKSIGRVAPQDVTVLILGESGTGKELVARAIYSHSRRASGPFLAINCSAIPETLLESELFGHEKGAFTGADRKRIGKFEQCSGGTLFLDEIGDMTPLTQTKLPRVLQEKSATNRPLDEMVAREEFRGDLYYRLNVFTIRLPALRDRPEDLPDLIKHFLNRFNQELGKDVLAVSEEAMAPLQRYAWPGNIRELQSVLKQALLNATGPVLAPEFLPPAILAGTPTKPPNSASTDLDRLIQERLVGGSQELHAEALAWMERQLLTAVLKHTQGNQLQAAKILGITRGSLRTKIRALGITIERGVWSENESLD
jgi:two-component system, NtrC family, nitrogen regulation response regulator GlnG